MVKIFYTKPFLRQYGNLPRSLQLQTKKAIKKFEADPKDLSLKVHKLNGRLADKYSFSVDYKHRIVFEFFNQGGFIFLKVGDHRVYG